MKRMQIKESQLTAARRMYHIISERKLIFNQDKGFWWYSIVIEA